MGGQKRRNTCLEEEEEQVGPRAVLPVATSLKDEALGPQTGEEYLLSVRRQASELPRFVSAQVLSEMLHPVLPASLTEEPPKVTFSSRDKLFLDWFLQARSAIRAPSSQDIEAGEIAPDSSQALSDLATGPPECPEICHALLFLPIDNVLDMQQIETLLETETAVSPLFYQKVLHLLLLLDDPTSIDRNDMFTLRDLGRHCLAFVSKDADIPHNYFCTTILLVLYDFYCQRDLFVAEWLDT